MRTLMTIIGACLLISTVGCTYYDRGYEYPNGYYYSRPVYYGYQHPYGYHYYEYGFWQDRRGDAHG